MKFQIIQMREQLNIAISQDNEVLYAGWGPPPDGMIGDLFTLINGDVAEYLYQALTGHRYEDHPDSAYEGPAWQARGYLDAMDTPAAARAREMINTWGERIEPWLGKTMLDDHGRSVFDAPEYDFEIELAAAA